MLRINWDQYEAAKLIEAYWEIQNSPASKHEVLKSLSELLRLYGVSRGYEIDEKYRNYNGIALQVSYIEGIFSNGQRGLKGASALFRAMATMYRDARNQYNAVVAEANRRMHVSTDSIAISTDNYVRKEAHPVNHELLSVEELFFSYMEKRSRYSRNEAVALLKKAADYCKYDGSILGQTDVKVIRDIQQKIAAGLVLRFRYGKKEATQIRAVIDLYYAFVKSYRKPSSAFSTDIEKRTQLPQDKYTHTSEVLINHNRPASSQEAAIHGDWVLNKLREMNLRYHDKRSLGGCLWVAGGHELDDLMSEFASHGYKFYCKPEGCNTFPNISAWWTKDHFDAQAESIAPIRALTPADLQILESYSKWLAEDQKLASATVNSYRSALKVSAEIIYENNLPVTLLQRNVSIARKAVDALMAIKEFAEKNRNQNNRYSAALARFVQFLEDGCAVVDTQQSTETIQEESAPWEMYKTLLLQGFSKGFQKESGLDLRKLRKRWQDTFGAELTDSDETVRHLLSLHCVDSGKRWYLSEQILSDRDQKIVLEYIESVLAGGKTVLFYASIYAALEEKLESPILTSDLLSKYLQATLKEKYYLSDRYLATEANAQVNVVDEIKEVMISFGKPIHTDELKAQLHHLPGEQVERELHLHREFIMDAFHMYFHEALIELSEEEKEGIAGYIQGILDEQGYMIGNNLHRELKQLYPELIERMDCLSDLGVRGVIANKLQDRFTFTDAVITPKGTAMNMIDIFATYCKGNTPFSLDDLTAFAAECGVVIYWDAVHNNCTRVSEDSFVANTDVQWDISRIDAAITLACPSDYVVLQKIKIFDAFPHVGHAWNSYLLEQYVATVSEQYMLLHSSYAKKETSGVIVRKSAGYESFDDVLVDLLANAPVALERGPCLEYLAEQGCITRKRLGSITEIIARAKLLRTQKG